MYVGYIDVSLDFAREEKCNVICFTWSYFQLACVAGDSYSLSLTASFPPMGDCITVVFQYRNA